MKAVYMRVSTANQNVERQLKKGDYKPYIDVCSGSVPFKDRKEGGKLFISKRVTEIHIKHVDRLGRNLKDILETIEHFTEKGVNIHIEQLGISTLVNGETTTTAKLIISLFGAVAELEKQNINQRTQEGREIAKLKGKFKGRKRGATSDIGRKNEMLITWLQTKLNEGVSISEITKQSNNITEKGISRTRIYDYLKRGLLVKNISNKAPIN